MFGITCKMRTWLQDAFESNWSSPQGTKFTTEAVYIWCFQGWRISSEDISYGALSCPILMHVAECLDQFGIANVVDVWVGRDAWFGLITSPVDWWEERRYNYPLLSSTACNIFWCRFACSHSGALPACTMNASSYYISCHISSWSLHHGTCMVK